MGIINSVKSIIDGIDKAKEELPLVTAVIVAAGKSERMGTSESKQLLPLCGMPVIAHTLASFEESLMVDEVVIVARSEDFIPINNVIKEYEYKKVVRIVAGGETRQKSVFEGIAAANENTRFIAIHDGARPLVSPQCIDAVVEAAFEDDCAAAAVRVKDTIKVADEEGMVQSTLDRSKLWSVQTPQVFEMELYKAAMQKAEQDNVDYTDDCQLVENFGKQVRLVEGEYSNIKITTMDDLWMARAILESEGDDEL